MYGLYSDYYRSDGIVSSYLIVYSGYRSDRIASTVKATSQVILYTDLNCFAFRQCKVDFASVLQK